MVPLKPIIFLLGPSGVGKTFVSTGLKEDYSFRHFVIHEKSFKANGFPAEWDEDHSQIDFANLATNARSRLAVRQRGAVLSIPTEMVFTRQQLEAATRGGVTPVVLWGPKELLRAAPSTADEQPREFWRRPSATVLAKEHAHF